MLLVLLVRLLRLPLRLHVLLVHLRKDPLFEITIPSKTQAYMAVGKPLLMAVKGDAADLVKQAQCGLTVESENPQDLADAVDALAAMPAVELKAMGANASCFYRETLSLQVGAAKFAALFASLRQKVRREEI